MNHDACKSLNTAALPLMDRSVKPRFTFATQPRWLLLAECLLILTIVGMVDFLTSWEVSLFVFYGVPIFIASWYAGRLPGFSLAALAGCVWYMVNYSSHPYETTQGYVWAAINRAVYFAFVAVGSLAMREQRQETLARLAAVTRAWELEQEIVLASEREQVRIGQDLHDGVCQNLAAIDCAAQCLREELEAANSPQTAAAAQIQGYLRETLVEARNLARGFFPVPIETEGLVSVLRKLVFMTKAARGFDVTLEADENAVPETAEAAMQLYRITQEALSNAGRHSGARHVAISLKREGGAICLSVKDDGRGFPAQEGIAFGIGIRAMHHRAQIVGGELEIRSCPGIGTTVTCRIASPNVELKETGELALK